jgi:hypothetical protein
MDETEVGKDKSTAEMEKCRRYYEIKFKRSLRDPKFILEILGFAILAVYAFFTILMYCANRDSADAAKSAADTAQKTLTQSIEAFRIDERAWVEIEPIKPTLLSPADAKFSATFTCNIYPKNVGKTIATDVVVKAEDSSSGEELGSNRTEMANVQDNYLLDKFTWTGTGKPVHVAQNPVPKVLAPNTVSAAPFRLTCQAPQVFSNGTQVLHYLIGRIDYCDQFQVRHWKKFCHFVVNARGEIWNCQEGNDEDHNPETTPDPSCRK